MFIQDLPLREHPFNKLQYDHNHEHGSRFSLSCVFAIDSKLGPKHCIYNARESYFVTLDGFLAVLVQSSSAGSFFYPPKEHGGRVNRANVALGCTPAYSLQQGHVEKSMKHPARRRCRWSRIGREGNAVSIFCLPQTRIKINL